MTVKKIPDKYWDEKTKEYNLYANLGANRMRFINSFHNNQLTISGIEIIESNDGFWYVLDRYGNAREFSGVYCQHIKGSFPNIYQDEEEAISRGKKIASAITGIEIDNLTVE